MKRKLCKFGFMQLYKKKKRLKQVTMGQWQVISIEIINSLC